MPAHRPLVLLTLLALHVLLSACARPVRMLPDPDAAGCRAPVSETEGARLAWIRPVAESERRALDARCAQVGPPLIVRGTTLGTRPVRRLAVATWNLHDGRGDIGRLVRDLGSGRHGAPAPDAVVLLLQEFVRATDADGVGRAPAVAASLGWHLAYVPARRTRPAGDATHADRGTAILSSMPMREFEAIELPVERQRRVALAATVGGVTPTGRAWSMRVVNAHLENRPGARRWWIRAGAARTRQVEALLDAINLDDESHPGDDERLVVLGGDLNTWLGRHEQALRLLRGAFPRWSQEDARSTLGLRLRLDHLFARLPAGVNAVHHRMDDRYGSDHHPVVAAIDFVAN